jgi:ADP-ribose pyrophosphatase YjhB (NUDIX family)
MPAHIRVSASAVIVRSGQILLVKFEDRTGPHYNLPGGGADPGETAAECCMREVLEETNARVDVGRLLLVREYEPVRCRQKYGKRHKLNLVYECALLPGSEPSLPRTPDADQVGVEWVPLDILTSVNLVSATLPGQILAALDGAPTLYTQEFC